MTKHEGSLRESYRIIAAWWEQLALAVEADAENSRDR
jgi:hypothetical protein